MMLIDNRAAQEQLAMLFAELKQARRRRGDLPQEVLAARLDVVTASVADWEAGRDNPSAVHLVMWSHELGLRVAITDSDGNEIFVAGDDHTVRGESQALRELRRLSATLRTVRTRRRFSQAVLAATLGVNRRSITRWESAEGYPRPIGFVLWAHALECSVCLLPI
jgi:DNA-binding transcriptional regulator YiaG